MDNPPKSLAAAEARIASKDAQLIEIEIELDRRKTSIEDLERKHWKLEQELERESQDTMEERLQLRAVTRELNETAEIVEEATTSINRLHAELRNVQEGAESSKGESVKRLEASEKTVDLRLEDVVVGRDMFVQDVHAKEPDILELEKDNKKLTVVRGSGFRCW
ncbi:unnamed protein product [Sphagnum jensenii]|uniref:Uncharacterized protein n=1 Tax=Sphagnum jensenii TaxID=128206 RepID=A0ABP1B2D2_9BRYO